MSRRSSIILVIVLLASAAYCADTPLNISAKEEGSIVSFFDEYFIVNINGTLTFSNPSSVDLYEVSLPLKLSPLVFKMTSNRSDTLYSNGRIYVSTLLRNTSKTISYRIFGITSDSSMVDGSSVVINAIQRGNPEVNLQNIGVLKKAPLEIVSRGGSPNTRLISAEFHNPTDFEYYIGTVKIIKTSGLDLGVQLNSWEFERESHILDAHETWNIDVLDEDAHEGEIYWLSADMAVRTIEYTESYNVSLYTEDDLYVIPENLTNATLNVSEELDFMIDRVYVRKIVSKSLVVPGDEVEVVLLINNFAPRDLSNASVVDTIPPGFEFADAKRGKSRGRQIRWDKVTVNRRETRRISYKLKYTDENSYGLDYFDPATIYYDGKTAKSQAVPFVRKFIPEKKLFVQKTIRFLEDEKNVQVTIQLQNLGDTPIEHIVLNEFLSSDSEFKEVTEPFAGKGLWKIDKINQSSSWEVSYVTDIVGVLNTFPVVYGVESRSVMKTIILSNVIKTEYSPGRIRWVEIGGVVAVLLIGIVFFLPKGFFRFGKKKDLSRIREIREEVEDLKAKTGTKTKDAVSRSAEAAGAGRRGIAAGSHSDASEGAIAAKAASGPGPAERQALREKLKAEAEKSRRQVENFKDEIKKK